MRVILAKGQYVQSAYIFSKKCVLVSRSFVLVTRNRCHHEGFSGYEKIHKLGS